LCRTVFFFLPLVLIDWLAGWLATGEGVRNRRRVFLVDCAAQGWRRSLPEKEKIIIIIIIIIIITVVVLVTIERKGSRKGGDCMNTSIVQYTTEQDKFT